MAMSVVYTVVDGVMWQEDRGGTITQYVPDTLGSVVAEMDETGQITHTADYWPYGEVRTETGTKKSPFGFVGVLGYMKDFSDALYVRARYLRTNLARWQTVDLLWPNQSSYGYCDSLPVQNVDSTGLGCWPCQPCSGLITDVDLSEKDRKLFLKLMECIRKAEGKDAAIACLLKYGTGISAQGIDKVRDYLACLAVQNMYNSLQGSNPPCNPCADMYATKTCLECCNMKYLSCLARCFVKHRGFITGLGMGVCKARCITSLNNCAAEVAAGEPC